jgi:peptidoglycan hydrolase-like protein with peptidoglycan-binding domain
LKVVGGLRARNALLVACFGALVLFEGGSRLHAAEASTSARGLAGTVRRALVTSPAPGARNELSASLGWVRNLQHDLRRLRFYSGPISGVYTPATRAAVIRFQKAKHLVPDGEWGVKSQAALDKALGRKRSAPAAKLAPLSWVHNLQRDLGRLHFYGGPVNGLYTPATRAAVIRFQKAKHLVPDGEWGVKSQAALDKAFHRNG